MEAMQEELAKAAAAEPGPEVIEGKTVMTDGDATFAADATITDPPTSGPLNKLAGQAKKKGKAKMTAKEKRERSVSGIAILASSAIDKTFGTRWNWRR